MDLYPERQLQYNANVCTHTDKAVSHDYALITQGIKMASDSLFV
jgi:hypothetical protein